LLKSAQEQSALIERYRDLIKALTFPVQILIRHGRLDLRPYLAQIQAQIPQALASAEGELAGARKTPEEEPRATNQWAELAESLEALLHQIGSQRTLIERHCYLVIPAPDLLSPAGRFALRRTRGRAHREELMARALQELSIRVDTLQAQLASLGLRARQMRGEELARLYQSCLTPEHALQAPLQARHLGSVGHFPRLKNRAASRQLVVLTEQEPPVPGTPALVEDAPGGPAHRAPRKQWPAWKLRTASALPQPDFLRLADLLAPGSLVEERDGLQVGDEWVCGIAVTAFPREVSDDGWLAPLLMLDDVLDLSLHLHPQPHAAMMRQLRRRRVGYSSTNAFNRSRGRLDDLEMGVAQNDVTRLMNELAGGGERIFELSFLLLVRAPTKVALHERCARLLAHLQTVFLDAVAHVTTFEHGPALRSFLPEAQDCLARSITLDTASIATTFPFISNALMMAGGVFLGLTATGEPVLLDPWHPSLENPHAFVGGVTGAGKSYFGKLWLLRALLLYGLHAEQCSVIDPDGEYTPLADALGGSVVRIAAGSSQHLNPFDLIPPGCDLDSYLALVKKDDRLTEKVLDLVSLLDVMLADRGTTLGTRERSLLEHALYEVYRRASISADPRTHYHQPPLLRDLSDVLKSGVCGQDAFDLVLRLSRYIDGSLSSLFAHQTNVRLDSHLLIWDIREMRGDLRPVGMFLIADTIWTQAIQQSHVRRALYIDEAASLIEHAEGGQFLASLSRRARKRYLRLVVMTQNPETFCQDTYGSVVAANAAIKILKKQDRTSVQAVASRFGLTPGEEQRLLAFGVQEALLLAGDRRVLLSVHASQQEHALITTNPVELAGRAEREHTRAVYSWGDSPDAQEVSV
jgi:hypothetical protein